MKWGGFAVALLATWIAQTTLVRLLAFPHLDLFLVLTLWTALRAPPWDARLAAWVVGMAQSLESTGPLGAHAVAHGVTGWLLTMLREGVNTRSFSGRFLATFLAAAAGQLLLRGYQSLYLDMSLGGPWSVLGAAALSSLVAAGIVSLLATWLAPSRRRMRYSGSR